MGKKTKISLYVDVDYTEYHKDVDKNNTNIFEVVNKAIETVPYFNNAEMYLVDSEPDKTNNEDGTCDDCTNGLDCHARECEKISQICYECKSLDCMLATEYQIANNPEQEKLL